MRVHVKLLGANNRPLAGLARWFYTYFMEAANGAVAMEESEDLIEEGDYELPDKDWVMNDDEEDEEEDEQDILGSTPA